MSDSAEDADRFWIYLRTLVGRDAQDSAILAVLCEKDTSTANSRIVGCAGALLGARHGSWSQARSSLYFAPPTAPLPTWIDRSCDTPSAFGRSVRQPEPSS